MGKVDQIVDAVFGEAFQRHRVELDREAGRLGRRDPFEDAGQQPAARDHREFVRIERVQRHVDPAHTEHGEFLRIARQLGGVGRQRKLPQRAVGQIPGKAAEQLHNFLPHQRLAAGDPDLFDPGSDEAPGDPVELFEREQFLAWQKRHRLGHAVSAPQIAAIRYREPEVLHTSAKPINKWNRHRCLPIPPLSRSRQQAAPGR